MGDLTPAIPVGAALKTFAFLFSLCYKQIDLNVLSK
jgi:hypothetical protein